mgnify:FL=1
MRMLITGASRGLGFALAAAAAERGHQVYAGVRTMTEEGPLPSLCKRYPDRVEAVLLDVTNENTIAAIKDRFVAEGTKLDAIVNNAAVLLGREKSIEELDMDEVEYTFDVNVFGPLRVVKHMLPLLRDGKNSIVLNVSSEAGSFQNAYGGDYPYALSKSALNMFTKQLRAAVKERGIRVYAVHPGWIRTDMGGEKAPGDPAVSARNLLDLIEGKIAVDENLFFIDHQGKAMPL